MKFGQPARFVVSMSTNCLTTRRSFVSAYSLSSFFWAGIEKPSFSFSLEDTRA